jgi:hypothetical protein
MNVLQKHCHDLGVCDYRRNMDWWIGFIDHLYAPLGTTLYSSLTHINMCPQSSTGSNSRFLAIDLTQWRILSFFGHGVARWLTFRTWTHGAIFSASLAGSNSRLTARLELWNSTSDSQLNSSFITILHGPIRKHRFQEYPYCSRYIYRTFA